MNDTVMMPPRQVLALDGRPLASPRPPFNPDDDSRQLTYAQLGELDDIELLFNDVLVAKFIRDMVSQHLKAAPETQREDQWQGVVGLVVKLGPTAFVSDEHTKFPDWGRTIQRGDWVLYRNSDGWDKDIQALPPPPNIPPAWREVWHDYTAVKCRVIQDAHIRGRVKYPGRLF